MRRQIVTLLLFPAAALTVLAPGSFSQAVAVAEVSGSVADTSGGAVAGAQLAMTETQTQVERTATSDPAGRYVFPNLPVGSYSLSVKKAGFKTYVQSGILLEVGNNVELNVTLPLGAVTESIEVNASAGMVETRQNTISQVIDQARITDLPLDGRQPTQLIILSGASVTTNGASLVTSKNFYSSTSISVAGGQGNSVNYLLDGGDNNDSFSNVNLPIPFPDALQEFSVETSTVPARYGLHPGGVVNAVTMSGTNEWHGDVFEFLRNGDVNARNFFAPVHDSLKRNQFGGTIGSHIIRNKLFFFAGFQGTFNRSNPPQSISYVPTAAALNGDFSAIDSSSCVANGRAISLIDPLTGSPFPNDQIPANRISPVAVKLASYLPPAQTPCGKVTYGIPTTGDDDQVIGRVDWVQNTKHTIYGRYYIDDYRNPDVYTNNLLTTIANGNLERAQSLTIGDNYVFNASTLNALHLTGTRRRDNRGPAENSLSPTTFGINVPYIEAGYVPITVSGYFSVFNSAPAYFDTDSIHVADDFDLIRGGHHIAFGLDYIRDQFNTINEYNGNGNFTFNGQYVSGKSVGDALAAFMLGTPSDFTESGFLINATQMNPVALYLQDSWKATKRLTVNMGIRWEPMIAPYDRHNHGNSFSQAAFNADQVSQVFTRAPAGLLFDGDPGIPKGFQNSVWPLFSPRLGIAWDPTGSGKQTIRVSGALLRDTEELFYNERLTTNAPYAAAVDVPYPTGGFSNPWSGYAGAVPFPLPSPLPANFTFPNAGLYVTLPIQPKPTYMTQWNISYQRQITANWLFSASYLGNKTTHIWVGEDINPAVYIPGSTASTNLRRPLYLQNPALGAAYASIVKSDQGGDSEYDGVLITLQHRLSHGFTMLGNYTYSHCLSDADFTGELAGSQYENPYNRTADRGDCNFNVGQVFNLSLIATSPVKGKGFTGQLLRDWRLAPIVSVHSGLPVNILDGVDVSESGIGLDRPNLIAANPYANGSNPAHLLNASAFQQQALGTFGSLGRNVLNGAGLVEVDLSLFRLIPVKERLKLEVRVEAFNVINHPNFVGAVTAGSTTGSYSSTGLTNSLTSPTFGNYQSANDPRIFQFSAKLHF